MRKEAESTSFRIRLFTARLALFLEALWPALWPPLAVAGLFVGLALLGVPGMLGPWLHSAFLALFALLFLSSLYRATRRLAWPDRRQGQRRLERDNDLPHRPLEGLDDSLVSDAPVARVLWQRHRDRLLAQLPSLRVAPPRTSWTLVDRWGLRAGLGCLLAIGLANSYDNIGGRLASALTPNLSLQDVAPASAVTVWVNPPAYTSAVPRALEVGRGGVIEAPINSQILAQVVGGESAPILAYSDEEDAFERQGLTAFRLTRELSEDGPLEIRQGGRTLASWELALQPDLPPTIDYLSPPSKTARNSLQIEYLAEDDYGVTQANARIGLVERPDEEALVLSLPLPSLSAESADGRSFHDLTPHPWAGLEVEIVLEATDEVEQQGYSEGFRMVLPERIFNHPVARALIEQRKRLTVAPNDRGPVIAALADIGGRPSHYHNDMLVTLAIVIAERELANIRRPEAIDRVQRLLWETALRIEDGEAAIAELRLRELQRQLMEALAEGASDEEIERLMNELQQALDEYLQALAQQMQEQMQNQQGELAQLPPNAQVMESQELQRMLEQARRLAESGMRDQARQMLEQLQQVLENLQTNPMAAQQNRAFEEARRMLNDLDEMMRRQQELMDESFRQSQGLGNQEQNQQGQQQQGQEGQGQRSGEQQGQGQRPGQFGSPQQGQQPYGGDPTSQLSQAQEALRRQLGELMRDFAARMGDIPQPLGNAERAMSQARDALSQGDARQAIDPQAEALEQLRRGLEAMLESFAQQMQGGEGTDGSQLGSNPGQGRDPLGRSSSNAGAQTYEDVTVPDEMEIRRAREILMELRRRRSDPERPLLELDYIDRLLRQF